jgi:MYXO-CTERM domain-containing protein
MDRRTKMGSVRTIVAGIVWMWAKSAAAEPTYQGYLDTALSLATPSPLSCALCHLSAAGGLPGNPNLAAFGLLLQKDGVGTNGTESQFVTVLAEIKVGCPKVYDDLLSGSDPNADVCAGDVHLVEYGCDVAPGAKATATGWVASLGVLAVAASRRRRGARCTPFRKPSVVRAKSTRFPSQ